MWIFYEPKMITVGNTQHFWKKKKTDYTACCLKKFSKYIY